jgi:hypothetical protein
MNLSPDHLNIKSTTVDFVSQVVVFTQPRSDELVDVAFDHPVRNWILNHQLQVFS